VGSATNRLMCPEMLGYCTHELAPSSRSNATRRNRVAGEGARVRPISRRAAKGGTVVVAPGQSVTES